MSTEPAVLIVAGPTASGKSALAIDAAKKFNGIVINADSMQVYRELRILTARPTPEDETTVPHRLYGVLPAAESCSVGKWLDLALAEIEKAHQSQSLPIIVGGTGLYLKALLEGLPAIPDIPAAVREEVKALHHRWGGEKFREELAKRDPVSAERIVATDTQRLIRAFEVVQATDRPLSDWQNDETVAPLKGAKHAVIVVRPPRDRLYALIEARFDDMIASGALEEAAGLDALGLPADQPAMKAVGVPEVLSHLRGEIPLETAVLQAKQASRNYAKRQLTWFRNQIEQNYTLSEQYSESLKPKIFSFIRNFLLTPPS